MYVHHIAYLRDSIHSLDSNPVTTMDFFKRPEIKMPNVREILKASAHYQDKIEEEEECVTLSRHVLEYINSREWLPACWQAHDCHFHVTFEEFVACPITCLNEIEEVLNKLLKEMNHA